MDMHIPCWQEFILYFITDRLAGKVMFSQACHSGVTGGGWCRGGWLRGEWCRGDVVKKGGVCLGVSVRGGASA